jgi:hypothetical protein
MIVALAAAVALATAPPSPSPDEIVSRAQTSWEARVVPPYVSFELPCADTFLAAQCESGDTARFKVRMSDGRTYARTVRVPGIELMCGGFITGPATTPLGFFRSIDANDVAAAIAPSPPPQNFAPDPFGPKAIASVVAVNRAYTVRLVGVESLDGESVYRLQLVPNYDPEHHPLRELWIDTATFEVVARRRRPAPISKISSSPPQRRRVTSSRRAVTRNTAPRRLRGALQSSTLRHRPRGLTVRPQMLHCQAFQDSVTGLGVKPLKSTLIGSSWRSHQKKISGLSRARSPSIVA